VGFTGNGPWSPIGGQNETRCKIETSSVDGGALGAVGAVHFHLKVFGASIILILTSVMRKLEGRLSLNSNQAKVTPAQKCFYVSLVLKFTFYSRRGVYPHYLLLFRTITMAVLPDLHACVQNSLRRNANGVS
jgi:hypothetical protein